MIYVLAVIAGIVGAAVGWFITGAVTAWVAGLCGMSDFEGARSTFAFLNIAPIGGLLFMIAAAWLVLRRGTGDMPFAPTLGPWRRPDQIDVHREDQPRAAPPDDPVELRYRVRRAGED